jgi:retinol dehydrogenase 14
MPIDENVVLITGASRGVGFATAYHLAKIGATIVMVSRDLSRGGIARDEISRAATGRAPVLFRADLSSLAEIRALAADVREHFPRIGVLTDNAGAMFARRELTADGIEKTFAINHLAPFLLTNLLLDSVCAAPGGRIIIVASESHSGALDFDNLQGERHYSFLAAYFRSKLANILFTYELARRLEGTGVKANCMSPGPTRTRCGDDMRGLPALFPLVVKRIPFLLASSEKGARTSVYLASSPEVAGISGRFFLRGRERRTRRITHDAQVARRLWSVSEELCGLTPSLADGVSASIQATDWPQKA